jgi:hypothetical protein
MVPSVPSLKNRPFLPEVPLGVLGRQTHFTCLGFECRKRGAAPRGPQGRGRAMGFESEFNMN